MDKLRITGGRPLEGEIRVSGAKNAALPIMCAALLTSKPLVLTNVPALRDVSTMTRLLSEMGVQAERSAGGASTTTTWLPSGDRDGNSSEPGSYP